MNIIFSVSHIATVLLLFFAPASEPDSSADSPEPPFVLFQPYEGEYSPPTHDDPEIIGSSYVMLNEFSEQPTLQFTIPEGNTLTVQKDFVNVHPNGSRSWVGRIDGSSWGYTILSVTDGVLWGKIYTGDGSQYHPVPVEGKEFHELRKVEATGLEEECISLRQAEQPNETEDASRQNTSICNSGATCDPDTVMMLVVYTADARQDLGGTASTQSAIASAISEMNLINANSLVDHTFLLVHTEEVSYNEAGAGTDLLRLTDGSDGHLDDVHDLREEYLADLVSLLVGSGGCGVGWLNGNPTNYSVQNGFHVVDDLCMTSNFSLAHEAGHNLGLNHDRYVYSPPDENPCAWAYGYVNQNAPGGGGSDNWRTVMAYNTQCALEFGFNCFRIPHWSNPDVTATGDPTGVPIGQADEAHAAYLLNRAICAVSQFRTEPDCADCVVYRSCENYVNGTSSGAATPISVSANFDPVDPNGPDVQVCVYTQGDHNLPIEVFEVYDEDGLFMGLTNYNVDDCSLPTERVCFNVDPVVFNNWISDDEIQIELDPLTNAINPSLCGFNRGCVEILIPTATAPVCSPGGFYSGAGASPEPLPSGTYHYQDSVTLSNYVVETGSDVIIKAELAIRLTSTFVVEAGGNLTTAIEPCP